MSVKIQLDKKKIALDVGDIFAEPLASGGRAPKLKASGDYDFLPRLRIL
jgi:hypothetical protein